MDFRANIRRILRRPKSRASQRKKLNEDANEADVEVVSKPGAETGAKAESDVARLLLGESVDHLQRPRSTHTSPSINPSERDSTSASLHDTLANTPSLSSRDKQDTDGTSLSSLLDKPQSELLPTGPPSSAELDPVSPIGRLSDTELASNQPAVVVQQPTPPPQNNASLTVPASIDNETVVDSSSNSVLEKPLRQDQDAILSPSLASAPISACDLPPPIHPAPIDEPEIRRQSLVSGVNAPIIQDLLRSEEDNSLPPVSAVSATSSSTGLHSQNFTAMLQRKIWVKRPGQSATLVAIQEDDLVDDVRDKILRKYANSLGKSFDSPDVVLRIVARQDGPRSAPQERMLGPEEDMCRTLDQYYPGGQAVTDALIIDIPPKRTPRPSPRQHHAHGSHGHVSYQALEEFRPHESGTDYFPPMPAVVQPVNGQTGVPQDPRSVPTHVLHLPEQTRSISVLQTGHVPPLPSPGAGGRRHRPKYNRQHTSSPTVMAHPTNPNAVVVSSPGPGAPQHLGLRGRQRHDSNASERPNGVPAPPPLPTPPAPEAAPTGKNASTPPTPVPRDHHRDRGARPRKMRKATPTNGTTTMKAGNSLISSMLDGSVPPINVLIVEDNIINLKLLEAFMKRLKVRWSTAMNGQIAVNKWRTGGFHLVLMDIQLPIMSGLDATKEIRRLERVNGIGVFSNSTPSTPMPKTKTNGAEGEQNREVEVKAAPEAQEANDPSKDRLNMEDGLFKSPVIIVALTASSLQSDRHEALAAGCNDFLTKPVNFVWLERKVKEWGCMQALIDYDGWRKWKDFSSPNAETAPSKANGKAASTKSPILDGVSKADLAAKAREKKAKRDKRTSADVSGSVSSLKRTSLENSKEMAEEDG